MKEADDWNMSKEQLVFPNFQPRKCLYTTAREVVENALDSAKSISELLVVEITIEEIGRSKFNSMIGLTDHERRDGVLYDDFETTKAREHNGRGMPHDDIMNMFGRAELVAGGFMEVVVW
ncbi:hypothetical protein MTR67_022992 [Solanum verrucosum]|uniref:Uncharacterized protein n=1 Tax=Solanum verrucosum TaxID=315347 RepID=A0AAF0QSQ4_SOLVR|nr:hypothetical protein MTR67_022992 [Solanum verrucosum]